MHNNTVLKKQTKQQGQSLVELVIWGSLFMLVLFVIPIVAKFGDVKNKHLEATRYSIWERTVWERGQQSDAELASRADMRIMSHPVQALTATERSSNPFWSSDGNNILRGEENNTANAGVSIRYEELSLALEPTKVFAYESPIPGNLGLESNGLVAVTVTTDIIDRFDDEGRYVENTNDFFTMSSTGEILTDSWSVETNEQFQDRVDGLVLNELVTFNATAGEVAANSLTIPWLGSLLYSEAADQTYILLGELGNGKGASDPSIAVYSEAIDRDTYVKDKPSN